MILGYLLNALGLILVIARIPQLWDIMMAPLHGIT